MSTHLHTVFCSCTVGSIGRSTCIQKMQDACTTNLIVMCICEAVSNAVCLTVHELVVIQVVCQDKKVVVAEAKTSCEQLLVAIVQDKRIADEQERQVNLLYQHLHRIALPLKFGQLQTVLWQIYQFMPCRSQTLCATLHCMALQVLYTDTCTYLRVSRVLRHQHTSRVSGAGVR